MQKRGLSNVIATVLIVLLALAAIAILWGFIAPAINSAGDSIVVQERCLTTTAKPLSCDPTTNTVLVQLDRGENVAQITAVLISGSSRTTDTQTANGRFGVTTHTFPSIQVGDTVQAATVILNENGESSTCQASGFTVTCGQQSAQAPAICGDLTIDASNGEECDNGVANGQACLPNYESSCTYCNTECLEITVQGGTCGDNTINGGERCDGTDLDSQTCETQLGSGWSGNLGCTITCDRFDTTGCSEVSAAVCGDGIINGDEKCDYRGAAPEEIFGTATCESEGFSGGNEQLSCKSDCTIDTTLCSPPTEICGNGIVEGAEYCDIGEDLTPNTADDVFDPATCEGHGLSGGARLACRPDCSLDTGSCSPPPEQVCGDGTATGTESCDYAGTDGVHSDDDLLGETCETQLGSGWSGEIGCKNTCDGFDTSKCTEGVVTTIN